MPHDSHTTHEPDWVAREGEDTPGEDDISQRVTLLAFDRVDPREHDPAAVTN